MEEKEFNYKYVAIIVGSLLFIVIGILIFRKSVPAGNRSYSTNCGNDTYKFESAKYGILVYGEVNPYKNLDFNQKEFSIYVTLKDNIIEYANGNTNQIINIPVENVIQVGLDYDCKGYYYIYYLNKSGELYSIKLNNNMLDVNYNSQLVSKNVKNFYLAERKLTRKSTCDEYDLIIKDNNERLSVNGCASELLERYWINNIGTDSELFVVSKNAKVENYLKDENGENIVAKKVFVRETDKYGVIVHNVYIVDKDDYLYYAEDYIKDSFIKYYESKVKNIEVKSDEIVVTYNDDTSVTLNAELAYDYKS